MIGRTIGNFRLVSRLGRGGMGEIYLGEHTGIQTRVAVKLLLAEVSADTEHVTRFFNEARIVSRIKHAGIVKMFDVGFDEGQAYLIMELLEGESLARRIQRSGRMSATQLADIGRQIASVLAATHAAGVTHRDLKPDNIFLVADAELGLRERVKVLDFGIAKLSSGTMSASTPRTVGTMGTPAYMAPEQWADSGAVDWRADAYSLGCVAFEMACGRPPFIAHTIAEAYTKHAQVPAPSARSLMPDLPPVVDALIARLLAKQPADRASSMAEIARAFEACGGGDGAHAALAPTLGAGSVSPTLDVPSKIVQPVAPVSNTTLGSSVGQREPLVAKPARRRVAIAAAAGAVLVAGVVFAVARSGASGEAAPVAPAAAAQPMPTPAPAPAPPPPVAPREEARVAPAPPPSPTPKIMKQRPRSTPAARPPTPPPAAPPGTPAAPPADNPLEDRT